MTDFLNVEQIAKVLNWTVGEVMEATRRREIPFLNFGLGEAFVEKEVLEMIKARPAEVPVDPFGSPPPVPDYVGPAIVPKKESSFPVKRRVKPKKS